jgi:hypothetical protein
MAHVNAPIVKLGITELWLPQPSAWKAAYDRVQIGMTVEEVESIFEALKALDMDRTTEATSQNSEAAPVTTVLVYGTPKRSLYSIWSYTFFFDQSGKCAGKRHRTSR